MTSRINTKIEQYRNLENCYATKWSTPSVKTYNQTGKCLNHQKFLTLLISDI